MQAIYNALGLKIPHLIHLPGVKYALKQNHTVQNLKEKLYSPKAVLNAVALLGWAPYGSAFTTKLENNDESFSLEEIIKYVKICQIFSSKLIPLQKMMFTLKFKNSINSTKKTFLTS